MGRLLLFTLAGIGSLLLLGAGALQPRPQTQALASAIGFGSVVQGAVVTQGFGCTYVALEPMDSACASGHFHSGIDLAAGAGTPVYAAADGVCEVINSPGGYGLHVVLQHSGRMATLYGHLSSVRVGSGELVSAGQQLGAVGSTGMSTGPHLHFEIRLAGVPVDPAVWLRALQDSGRRPRQPPPV